MRAYRAYNQAQVLPNALCATQANPAQALVDGCEHRELVTQVVLLHHWPDLLTVEEGGGRGGRLSPMFTRFSVAGLAQWKQHVKQIN